MENNWKRKFVVVYTGQAFSLVGSAAVQFAVIWWLTVQKESAITLTLATLVSFLPNVLLGPFAGVWIDRYNRRTVMIAADGLVALSSIAMGVVFLLTDNPPVWFIYLVLFIRGIGNTFHSPAMQAAIPMFVPAEMLTKVGGWGNLIVSVSAMLGPALGAGLMSAVPMSAIMLVDIVGAAFAVLCLLTISIPDIPSISSVHNATEHSYVKEQSKGCSFAISMGLSAPLEWPSGCSFSFIRPCPPDTQWLPPGGCPAPRYPGIPQPPADPRRR